MTTIEEAIKRVIDTGRSLPPNKVVGGLKHITVIEGKENEFESLYIKLLAEVRNHDKGINYYDVY